MKKAKKILVLLLCAVLLVGASIAGTVAYLTDTDNVVTNTFTVGEIEITLDEAMVDEYGRKIPGAVRVTENAYLLVPGCEYVKDPTVHVKNTSEDCYIFVTVDNQIAAVEADTTIAAQIAAKGWTELSAGVYYKTWKQGDAVDLVVFEKFTVKADVTGDVLDDYTGKKVIVNAYAIQQAGFEGKPAEAWTAVSAAANG